MKKVMPRRPVQKRALITREKLLSSLEALLREHEFEEISIADIAGRAGVAVGSVYSHFRDRNAFLEALLAEYCVRVEQRLATVDVHSSVAALKTPNGLRSALVAAADAAIKQAKEDGHIIRATYNYARLHPESQAAEWERLRRAAVDRAVIFIAAFENEVVRPDRRRTALMLHHFFNVILLDYVLFKERSTMKAARLSDRSLAREIADMAYGYLKTAPAD